MDRRKFIQLLTTSAVGVYALDPEALLWVPGEKTIFIPPTRQLIYAAEIAAREWENNLDILKEVFNKDKILYEIIYDKPMYKHESGDYKTVQIFYGFGEKK